MKILLSGLFLMFFVFPSFAQTGPVYTEGKVTYVSSQNVYVRFNTTEGLKEGDTLFTGSTQSMKAGLKVISLSSTSCVCSPLNDAKFTVSQPILTNKISKSVKAAEPAVAVPEPAKPMGVVSSDTAVQSRKERILRKQQVRGRVYATSYSDFSNMTDNTQRMRFGLSLNATNINNSRLSAETYVSFYVKNDGWEDVKKDIFNGLKIYSLALKYEIGNNATIWFGRKINPRISNMGAVDGLQFELKSGAFTTGLILGSRPDYKNYGFNPSLMQAGAYVSHDLNMGKNFMQNTLAFVEQQNSGKTDRRFLYYQHSSTWFKDLYFFGSAEVDIYKKVYDTASDNKASITNSPKLTNLYLSLRYNVTRQLGLTLSYSERQNIIYYETYKTIVEQLLEAETSKGFLFNVYYRPLRNLSLGVNTGYRFQKSDPRPSKNIYAYVNYANVPLLKAQASLSVTALESSYLTGLLYSLGLSRDFMEGKFNLGLVYRMVDYTYENSNINELQHIAELSMNMRVYRKLSMGLNYEGTLIEKEQHNRIYVQLMQRF